MKTIKLLFLITIINSPSLGLAQEGTFIVNDIFSPELRGPVKILTEYILSGQDTLRAYQAEFGENGIKKAQYINSKHPELGFVNDSTCWKKTENSYFSFHCRTDSPGNAEMVLGEKGLITEIKIIDSLQEINYVVDYYESKRIQFIYTALIKDGAYQIIATQSFSYNEKGLIDQKSAKGGNQPQGLTTSYYNEKGLLNKTIRTDSDGNELFVMTFEGHDKYGNWALSKYQNGIIVKRKFEYYEN